MSRLFDPMRKDGTFPFHFTRKESTSVEKTWDRLCPGWRDRKPDDRQQPKVAQLNQKARRK